MLDIIQSPEFGQFVANMLIALVAIVVPLIGTAVRGLVQNMARNSQFEILQSIAKTAVLAAEQAGLSGVIGDKKAAAMAAAQAMLADRGLQIDLESIDAAIEAAVATELNSMAINEASYQKSRAVTGGGAA